MTLGKACYVMTNDKGSSIEMLLTLLSSYLAGFFKCSNAIFKQDIDIMSKIVPKIDTSHFYVDAIDTKTRYVEICLKNRHKRKQLTKLFCIKIWYVDWKLMDCLSFYKLNKNCFRSSNLN